MTANGSILSEVQDYYGKVLSSKDDLKSDACCTAEAPPRYIRDVLAQVHAEVHQKYYGCGTPLPFALEGKTVLDLGSGTGRDCFVVSKLVGETGRVIGLDMTDEQLAVANKHIDFHTKQFGYKNPNVEFRKGYIEDLAAAGIEDSSVDLVISNCVINLSPDKERCLSEIFRVLKPGGELYFSDIFSDRRIPDSLREDPVLYGECLSGALYTEDFRRILEKLGCPDFRVAANRVLGLESEEIEEKVGMITFYSSTIRAFKLDSLEDRCEDYGQVAYYLGTMHESPHEFLLDDHHLFKAHQPMLVCGNTAAMLTESRYAKHFRVEGNRDRHFGLFDCSAPAVTTEQASQPGACC